MENMEYCKVSTKKGNVVGEKIGNSIVFKGIPYASPPLGPLRFRAPVEHPGWEGDLMCDRWPADVYKLPSQRNPWPHTTRAENHSYSEDCLYMNIWTPVKRGNKCLPVLFWLYGAGGGSHDDYIDGRAYNANGCILVSFNYRIGILGCFGLEELAALDEHGSTGAYGIMDILFALKWVKENIAVFGGDPDNITIFGHSAGAMYTKLLLGCPPAWGLFQHVISLSGGGTWDIDVIQTKENKCRLCRQLLNNIGWTVEDAQFRPVEELYAALSAGEQELKLPQKSMLNTLFLPSVDGWLIQDYYGKILCRGEIDKGVDVMCGMLSEEWHNFPCQIPNGIGDYTKEFALAPVITWAQTYQERGIKPIYSYFFDRPMPGSNTGMHHGDELPYIFGCLDRYDWPWTSYDRKIETAFVSYFANFAKTGNPNGPGLPEWRPYTKEDPVTLHIAEGMIQSEDISSDARTQQVVAYLLEHPGILDDPFPPVSLNG